MTDIWSKIFGHLNREQVSSHTPLTTNINPMVIIHLNRIPNNMASLHCILENLVGSSTENRDWCPNIYHLRRCHIAKYITPWLWYGQPGGGGLEGVEKLSQWALVFKYFPQFEEKQGLTCQVLFIRFAPRLYNSYNHAHATGQHMWLSPGPGPYSKCSKTAEVLCSC